MEQPKNQCTEVACSTSWSLNIGTTRVRRGNPSLLQHSRCLLPDSDSQKREGWRLGRPRRSDNTSSQNTMRTNFPPHRKHRLPGSLKKLGNRLSPQLQHKAWTLKPKAQCVRTDKAQMTHDNPKWLQLYFLELLSPIKIIIAIICSYILYTNVYFSLQSRVMFHVIL